MSTAEEFAQHLATVTEESVTTSKLPAKPNSADAQWAVMADGGEPESGGNVLLWKRLMNLRVTNRNKSAKAVYDAESLLLAAVASFRPTQSFPVLSRGVVPMTDTDRDAEERQTGSWQVQLTVITK